MYYANLKLLSENLLGNFILGPRSAKIIFLLKSQMVINLNIKIL